MTNHTSLIKIHGACNLITQTFIHPLYSMAQRIQLLKHLYIKFIPWSKEYSFSNIYISTLFHGVRNPITQTFIHSLYSMAQGIKIINQ
jgi:hypothetical protein